MIKRHHLLHLLKFLLVLALFAFVFNQIQWQDRYLQRTADGGSLPAQVGKIRGPWDGTHIVFVPAASQQPLQLKQGQQTDGRYVEITPGIPTYIANFDWRYLPFAALSFLCCAFVAATRWWWLLHINRLPISWLEAIRYTWIGMFFNNIMPGQTGGDLIKAVYVVRKCKTQRVTALFSILVDRVLGLSSLLLLGGVVTLFALGRFAELALGIWGLLSLLVVSAMVLFSRRIRRRLKIYLIFPYLPLFAQGVLAKIDRAATLYKGHLPGIGLCLLIGMVNQSLYVLTIILLGYGLGVGMPPLEYFALVPLIAIISALPLAPNGWGVGELAFGYLFSTYGAEYLTNLSEAEAELAMRTRGVALSVLFRIHASLLSLLGGVLVLVGPKDQPSKQEIQQELALEEREAAAQRAQTKHDS